MTEEQREWGEELHRASSGRFISNPEHYKGPVATYVPKHQAEARVEEARKKGREEGLRGYELASAREADEPTRAARAEARVVERDREIEGLREQLRVNGTERQRVVDAAERVVARCQAEVEEAEARVVETRLSPVAGEMLAGPQGEKFSNEGGGAISALRRSLVECEDALRTVESACVEARDRAEKAEARVAEVEEERRKAQERLTTLRHTTVARLCKERDQANTRAEKAEAALQDLRGWAAEGIEGAEMLRQKALRDGDTISALVHAEWRDTCRAVIEKLAALPSTEPTETEADR